MSTIPTKSEYMFLFRGIDWHQSLSAEEIQKKLERFTAWFERLRREGKVKTGFPLEHKGKIVAGTNAVMDGPFAESKEAIAGYFIVQAVSLEDAVETAKGCPGLDHGQTVEVRPIGLEPGKLQFARENERSKISRQQAV
jgi:hypothetical protein